MPFTVADKSNSLIILLEKSAVRLASADNEKSLVNTASLVIPAKLAFADKLKSLVKLLLPIALYFGKTLILKSPVNAASKSGNVVLAVV